MRFLNGAVLIMALAIVGWAYSAANSGVDDVRKELEAVYAKIDKAIVASDMKTLESLLSDDYEKIDGEKTISRADSVAQMKKSLEMVKDVESCKTTINKISQVEGNQIVDYTQVAKVVMTGDDGKDTTEQITTKGRDWWVKGEDGKWMCVGAEKVK